MSEFLYYNKGIIAVPIILTIFFYIRCGFIGIKYDYLMKKEDSTYNENNSFKFDFGNFAGGGLVIPKYLNKNENLIINNIVERFNKNLTGMWISLVLIGFVLVFSS